MNRRALAILAGLVLLIGCREAQPRSAYPMTSAELPARSSVLLPVDGGSGETPGVVAGEHGTPAITVVTSARVAVTSAPESDNRARIAQGQSAATPTVDPVASRDDAGSSPAPSSTYATAEAEVWAAVQAYFQASEWEQAMRVARCESGGTYEAAIIGAHGEQGIYQVRAVYHGAVPPDIAGQVAQAAGIVARHGWGPWSCR